MSGLFRDEVLESRQARRFGGPILLAPLSFKLGTMLVVVVIAALVLFFYFGTYTRKRTVKGYVRPSNGVVSVHASHAGTIVARYAHLGDRVQKGDKLYKVVFRHSTPEIADVNAALRHDFHKQTESLKQQKRLAHQQRNAHLSQIKRSKKSLQAQVEQLGSRLKTEHGVLDIKKQDLSRYRTLAHRKMVSESDLQKIKATVLDARQDVEKTKQNRLALQAQLSSIPAKKEIAKDDAAGKIADIKAEIAPLDRQALQLAVTQMFIVRAPIDGTVSSVTADVGKTVSAQMTLMDVLPGDSEFQVRLLVPTKSIGFVHPGERVLVRYKAFPYQRFGLYKGKVERVSRSIVRPGDTRTPVKVERPYYMVTAALQTPYVTAYGRQMPLSAGMTLSADIVLGREPLYRWILRPVESLKGPL